MPPPPDSWAYLQSQVVAGLPLHHSLHLTLTRTDDVLVLNRSAAAAVTGGGSDSSGGGRRGGVGGGGAVDVRLVEVCMCVEYCTVNCKQGRCCCSSIRGRQGRGWRRQKLVCHIHADCPVVISQLQCCCNSMPQYHMPWYHRPHGTKLDAPEPPPSLHPCHCTCDHSTLQQYALHAISLIAPLIAEPGRTWQNPHGLKPHTCDHKATILITKPQS
jgi:hypothetical protein